MATAYATRTINFTACLGLIVAAQIAHAGSNMPPGAFLHQPAPDIAALNRQVQSDRLVAERYARLYNMSPEMVRAAFSKMKLSVLSEDHVYEVHYVHPGEQIGYKIRRVRKGTAIYRMPDGTPALVKVCGNPIRATQPRAVRGAFRRAPELGEPEAALDFQPFEPLEAPAEAGPITAADMRDAEPFGGFIESPGLPGPSEIPITPIDVVPAVAAVHTVSNFANAIPAILAPVGALAGLLASSGESSGSAGTLPGAIIVPPITGNSGTPPPVVTPPIIPPVGTGPAAITTPEPNAALLAAALLSAGFAGWKTRRRKR